MIRIAILGATGRMGQLAQELVDADSELKLHAALNSASSPELMVGADVVLDFTLPEVSPGLVRFAIEHDQKIVVGTSGWSESKLMQLEPLLKQHPKAAVVLIPNFSIGSMLAQSFAAQAAKYFSQVEIIEAHHAQKVDSPSGTAIRTAEQISKARGQQPLIPGVDGAARGKVVEGVPVHSIRLPGVSARQDVIFGGDAELLTISHDVSSHRAYAAGIRLAIDYATKATGLAIGLEAVVGR